MSSKPLKSDRGLRMAIDKAGGASKLAALLGLSPAAISYWKIAPVNRVPDIERFTGVPRHVLRPDFWIAPDSKSEDAA